MRRLLLQEFLSGDDYYHMHRADVRNSRNQPGTFPETAHRHTFCELFLIEEGVGTHLLNEQASTLKPQTLCLIRQDDTHAISSRSGLRLVNIAFPADSLSALCQRYDFSAVTYAGAAQWDLGERDFSLFRSCLADLSGRPNTRIALELFLLQVLDLVQRLHAASTPFSHPALQQARIPGWVREFFRLLNSEEHMAMGIDTLTDLVGYSREHASRQIQRYYGTSPSAVRTEARIRYARRELHMSDTPIIQIALACGFSSLSRFYAVFRKSVGITPAAFRRRRP